MPTLSKTASLRVERRPGQAADAIGGVVPGEVVRPRDTAEVVQVMRAGGTVLPVGGRSKLGYCPAPRSCDLMLDSTGLDRIVEHTAGDLVVIAEAGVRLDALQERVGAAGQMLALDPPEPGATLGGVVSANASGPRRLRYGTARDLLIGVTVVLADGTTAKAGGKVVKNVAGYDLGKLFTGAHGSLGVVVSTTWRLHPLPRTAATIVRDVTDADEAGHLALAMFRSTLTPTAVEVEGETAGALRLVALFESIAESVDAQAEQAIALLGGGEVLAGVHLGGRPAAAGALVLRIAHVPAALPRVLKALPPGSRVASSACVGVTYAALPTASPAAVAELRTAIAAYDGSAVVVGAPSPPPDGLDHWGPIGNSLDLMRRVKDRFDPEHRLSPGRFVAGI